MLLVGCAAPGNEQGAPLAGADGSVSSARMRLREVAIDAALIARARRGGAYPAGSPLRRLVTRAEPYTIGKGDMLAVVVWNHPELTNGMVADDSVALHDPAGETGPQGFLVDHTGTIQFPFAGALKVEGLTQGEARKRLITALAKYIKDPIVTLRVQAYRSKRIYVDGQVRAPGLHAITDIPMSLIEAINRAGGVNPDADQSRFKLVRAGITYDINLPELLRDGIDPANFLLVHGDILKAVSRDESKVFLTGEVIAPRALTMRDGRLTLNEALGEVGGVNPLSGDASRIYVVRKLDEGQASVFRLDASEPGAMALAEGFDLQARDVVFVSPTRLANWHRTISQMLPGAISSAVGAVRP